MRTGTLTRGAGVRGLHREEGLVLIIALIVLVAMTLASVAMIRSVDTSTVIAGNIAFKQQALASADAGLEAAISWLSSNAGTTLEDNSSSNGYYATSQDSLDITGLRTAHDASDNLDWSSSGKVKKVGTDASGNEIAYVIHRMCNKEGQVSTSNCATDESVQGGSSKGALRQEANYQAGTWPSVANRVYYRITVRVTGPKNAANYTQAIVSQ